MFQKFLTQLIQVKLYSDILNQISEYTVYAVFILKQSYHILCRWVIPENVVALVTEILFKHKTVIKW